MLILDLVAGIVSTMGHVIMFNVQDVARSDKPRENYYPRLQLVELYVGSGAGKL